MIINDSRLQDLETWLKQQMHEGVSCQPISGDASFRRYFRVRSHGTSYIAVDTPVEHEDITAFISVAHAFKQHQLQVPHVVAVDEDQGFMLLTDLGDDLLLRILNPQNADALYQKALTTLVRLQSCQEFLGWQLPLFDQQRLQEELQRFIDWYLIRHLNLNLSDGEKVLMQEVFNLVIASALEQPQVCVHRDYHSRNLLLLKNKDIGIVDFQDAVFGPVTYDLVSLLRDCYIAWPKSDVERWAILYHDLLVEVGVLTRADISQFLKWFDLMGIQRHLKVLGIFARLYYRDGKSVYLQDMPRTVNYILEVSQKYPELTRLHKFFTTRVIQ